MKQLIRSTMIKPDVIGSKMEFDEYIIKSPLSDSLVKLVKLRVSQINECEYCIDRFVKDARIAGESDRRVRGINIWSSAQLYSDRERAALAWAEVLTRISLNRITTDMYTSVKQFFNVNELTALTSIIQAIRKRNHVAPVSSDQQSFKK